MTPLESKNKRFPNQKNLCQCNCDCDIISDHLHEFSRMCALCRNGIHNKEFK